MSKLGFTFYPKDWWTSDTFFELEPIERYIYLECLFLMYQNDGYIKNDKQLLEKRLAFKINDDIWSKITQHLTQCEFGLTHKSVNKRLRRVLANRANGAKGGRPKKPRKPNEESQKNPPLESEVEIETELESEVLIEDLEQKNSEIKKEILASGIWIEAQRRHHKLSEEDFNEKFETFWQSNYEGHILKDRPHDINGIKRHFSNWIKKQQENGNSQKGGSRLDRFSQATGQ